MAPKFPRVRPRTLVLAVIWAALVAALWAPAPAAAQASGAGQTTGALTGGQRAALHQIAADTWQFYAADVDPVTHLPLDNLGPGSVRGTYTSASDIGVYLWAVVAARDLGLIDTARADQLASQTLAEVATLKRYKGMLYQWYDTSNGNVLLNPGQGDCTETTPSQDNCWFVSAVDNGWYATGLIEVRRALPQVSGLANRLLAPMDFSIFYDNRAQTACDVNASLPGDPPTGQQYGGYYVDQGPAGYHNGALYSDPRISMYIGMGRHQMPGDVWWRTWRTWPPQRCATDPVFPYTGTGYWQTYTDPQSGKQFPALHLSRDLADVRADVRRRHVRGADGQPGRARDDLGIAQLRSRRPALGAGADQVRDPGAGLPGLGNLTVEHGR